MLTQAQIDNLPPNERYFYLKGRDDEHRKMKRDFMTGKLCSTCLNPSAPNLVQECTPCFKARDNGPHGCPQDGPRACPVGCKAYAYTGLCRHVKS
jgi:hypothetical protein